jgi:hypothetical protein
MVVGGGPCTEIPERMFSITVTDNNPQPSTFALANGDSQLVTLGPGTYTVTENVPFGFTIAFSGDCTQSVPLSSATGTISAGQHQTCTITNTELIG